MGHNIRQVLSELIKSNRTVETRKNSISSIKSADTLTSYITNSDSNTIAKSINEGHNEKNEIIIVNADDVENEIDINYRVSGNTREKAYEDFVNKK